MKRGALVAAIGVLLSLTGSQVMARGKDRTVGSRRGPAHIPQTRVPELPVDIILGRPTATAMTMSVLAYSDTQGQVAYGTGRSTLRHRTPLTRFAKGEPVELVLGALLPNTRYH